MAFGKSRRDSMSIDELRDKISESQILSYYFGIESIPCVISSPLRTDDHPSLSLNTYNGEHVFFRDFKTGDTGNTFILLQKFWAYKTIQEVISRITEEMLDSDITLGPNIQIKKHILNSIKEVRIEKEPVELKCKVREWRDYDLSFWGSFGISLPWLKFSRTFPISHIIIIKDNRKIIVAAEKYAYAYVEFKDGKESIKIYQPYSTKHKWSNNHGASVWDLWEQLPEFGDDLIITSSKKDALCVWENTGIPSCSLQAESYLPKHQVVDILKSRFKRIWVLYDNDAGKDKNAGRILGKKIADEFGLTQIEIHEMYLSKDPSDLRKNHGANTLREVIFKLINKK